MIETEDAVQRFLKGDEEAFSLIVRHWERKIYNLAWRMTGNREDAQDAVQETFLSVFKAIGGLRDPGSFPTWLYQITLNHCRGRRKYRNSRIPQSNSDSDYTDNDENPLPTGSAIQDPEDSLETVDLIRKALAGLSEDHRMAIVLKEYMGLSLEELAAVMECPLSTAKSRLYHGLQAVQRNLKRLGVMPGQERQPSSE
jgi:RNA polymerase sigma-70 factor, ECF subfamily